MSPIMTKIVRCQRSMKLTINLNQYVKISTVINSEIKSFDSLPSKKIPFIPSSFNLMLSGGPAYLHEHCDKLHQELGPIFRENLGGRDLVFVADTQMIQTVLANEGLYPHHNVPEAWLLYNKVKDIKRGLFFQLGEPWAKLRGSFNKVMLANPKNMTRFGPGILDISSQFLSTWLDKQEEMTSNDDIVIEDVKAQLCRWSIETTGYVLFGERMGCVSAGQEKESARKIESNTRAKILVDSVQKMFEETSKFQMLPCTLAQRLRLPAWVRFERASDDMLNAANTIASDYIGRTKLDKQSRSSIVRDLLNLNKLSIDEISRSIVDLIIAAADTTSSSVQWMLHLIAKHPDIQSKLLAEVEPIFEKPDQIDWLNFRQSTPYLHAFMRETSRLYPVAPFMARTLDHDIVLNGYKIPAGKTIIFSLYTTSRMERYFNKPLAFRPERWLRHKPLSSDRIHAHASLPFGAGSRMCIGRRAAEMEMSLLIAVFVKKFRSYLSPSMCDVRIKLKMILSPHKNISLILTPRQSSRSSSCGTRSKYNVSCL